MHLGLECHKYPENYVNNSESNIENHSDESVEWSVEQSVEQVENSVFSRASACNGNLRSTHLLNTTLNTHKTTDSSTENDEAYLLNTNSHFIKEDCLDDTDSTDQQNFDSYIQGLNNHIPIYLSRVIYYSPAELLASYPLDLTVTCKEVISYKKNTTKTFETIENTAFLLETSESVRYSHDTVAIQLRYSHDTVFKRDK